MLRIVIATSSSSMSAINTSRRTAANTIALGTGVVAAAAAAAAGAAGTLFVVRRMLSSTTKNSDSNSTVGRRPFSSTTTTTTTPTDGGGENRKKNRFLHEQFSLQGKCAIVTGGGTGIGAALAMGMARAGASVVLTGRRIEPLQQCRTEIIQTLRDEYEDECYPPTSVLHADYEHRVIAYPFDVTHYDGIPEFLQRIEEQSGGIPPTILVNNAGINVRQPMTDLTVQHFDTSFHLMLIAPFMIARAMGDNFKRQQYGRVINIASLQSYKAFPNSIPYASAKAGTLGLTRSMAEAFSPVHGYENVTINAIAPGFVETELTASVFADNENAQKLADKTLMGRNSIPQDLIGTCVFLASPASSYITGHAIPVDGGFSALGHR